MATRSVRSLLSSRADRAAVSAGADSTPAWRERHGWRREFSVLAAPACDPRAAKCTQEIAGLRPDTPCRRLGGRATLRVGIWTWGERCSDWRTPLIPNKDRRFARARARLPSAPTLERCNVKFVASRCRCAGEDAQYVSLATDRLSDCGAKAILIAPASGPYPGAKYRRFETSCPERGCSSAGA